jgi:dynein heavy chain
LKQRHWDVISEILEYEFSDEEPLTLGKLSEINAFKSGEQLQEVSGQASSEASLEAILKKVEDSWKSTELMVLPHKDSKHLSYSLSILSKHLSYSLTSV